MRTVLIPTDFSGNARHAIDYSLQLFKCVRTNFYLLHAYADEVYGPFKNVGVNNVTAQKNAVKQKTDLALDQLKTEIKLKMGNPLHSFVTVSSFESLVDAVNDFVNKINIDLVIMGTQGETSNKNIIFGSHTVQVFKYVQCPVLAIPEEYVYEQPKKILFPTDYMIPYKRRELKLLRDIATQFKSEVHCLYISDFEVLSNRQLDNQRFIKGTLSDVYLFFAQEKVTNKIESILENIEKKEISLLVMVNSRHSFMEYILYRSTVDALGLKIKIPFLVMQNLPR